MKGIHPMFILASALDPRSKCLLFMKEEEKVHVWKDIINGMVKIFCPVDIDDYDEWMSDETNGWLSQLSGQFYEEAQDITNACRNDIINECKTPEDTTNDNNEDDNDVHDHDSQFANYFGEGNGQEDNDTRGAIIDVLKQEVAAYKAEEGVLLYKNAKKGEFNDPLQWWKQRLKCYPHLAALARIILAAPATSAPSERIFSVATNIVSKKRSRLDLTLACG